MEKAPEFLIQIKYGGFETFFRNYRNSSPYVFLRTDFENRTARGSGVQQQVSRTSCPLILIL